jgi:hypothetical protein
MKKIVLSLLMAVVGITATAQVPAFPGAEGYGRYVTGGRGTSTNATKVYHVTNLQDNTSGSIAGSLRWALKQSGPRTIVFDVGGIIELKTDLTIPANTTIAGQTAPSPGITLRYYTVRPVGNNVIVRFIRIRRGEEKDINDGADATWAKELTNVIFDHCSFSWSIDEVASYYDNCNFTMQWCTIGEALANPGHTKGEHSYGGIWGGKGASFHHNMIIHVQNRAPRLNGARYGWTGYDKTKYPGGTIMAEQVDLRNNLMYNWGTGNGAYGGMGGYHNIVNNYYKAGPATANTKRVFQCGHTTGTSADQGSAIDPQKKGIYGHFYISGNYVTAAGSNAANYDWKGVIVDDAGGTIPDTIKLSSPISTFVNADVTTHTAENAYLKILSYGGASLYRDNVDKRYMSEAKNGTTTYTGSATKTGEGKTVTHHPGIIDFVKDQGTYSIGIGTRPNDFDTDKDGIPDAWEDVNGLDKKDASDATIITLDAVGNGGKGWYTNLEVYLSSLVQDIMQKENMDAESSVDEYYPAFTKPDDPDTPDVPTVSGNLVWEFDNGAEGQKASYDTNYFSSDEVIVGSHLKYNGSKTSDIKMTLFTITDEAQDVEANDGNAVKFSFTVKDGYQFVPTNVSFNVTRFGTNNGSFSSYLLYANNEKVIVCCPTEAYRDNGKAPDGTTDTDRHYALDQDIDDADAMTGTNALVINLFNIPYNANTKNMGLANVVINGYIITPTGVNIPVSISPVMNTEYFNIAGQRVSSNTKGLIIEKQRLENGQVVTRKVMK